MRDFGASWAISGKSRRELAHPSNFGVSEGCLAGPLRQGLLRVFPDVMALGGSHPCTTFDNRQIMFLVNDTYGVIAAIRMFF